MATLPASGSPYGDISSAPGRRSELENVKTLSTLGSTALTNATTVKAAEDAIYAIALADKATSFRRTGRARSVESGGGILGLTIVSGGSGYSNATGVALTGGSGSGATADLVQTAGAVTSFTITSAGSGYVVGDLLSESSITGTGLSLRVTSIR